jgi:hypothetical protein
MNQTKTRWLIEVPLSRVGSPATTELNWASSASRTERSEGKRIVSGCRNCTLRMSSCPRRVVSPDRIRASSGWRYLVFWIDGYYNRECRH